MRTLFTIILLSLSTFSFAECDLLLEESNTCIEYTWTDGPHLNSRADRKFSELVVKYFDADDATETAIENDIIKVLPWMIMPNMEHGTRPVVTTELEDGSYLISEILLKKMMGHWEIRFVDTTTDSVLASFKVQ
mgnify:CR=1 FL=1